MREWQKASVHAGKNFHASGSWGPWIETGIDYGSLLDMVIKTVVDGKLVQNGHVSDMISDIPKIIAFISSIAHLWPGDIIATGSPDYQSDAPWPDRSLKVGQTVEVSISGVGTLSNRIMQLL